MEIPAGIKDVADEIVSTVAGLNAHTELGDLRYVTLDDIANAVPQAAMEYKPSNSENPIAFGIVYWLLDNGFLHYVNPDKGDRRLRT